MEQIIQIPMSSFLNPLDETLTVDQKKKLTNVRKRYLVGHLDDLKESIKAIGVKIPLLVRPLPDGKYEIICGQRRYLAVLELNTEGINKIETLPVIVRDLSDKDARILSTIDDVQHSAADTRDRGDQIKILMTELKDLKLVAQVLGLSEDTCDLMMSATAYNDPIPEDTTTKIPEIPEKIFYPGNNNTTIPKASTPTKKGVTTLPVPVKEVGTPTQKEETVQKSFPFYITFSEDVFDALWKYSKSQLGDQKDILMNFIQEAVKEKLKELKYLA